MFYYSESDNLGTHTASQNLNINNYKLTGVSGVDLLNSWQVKQTSTTLSVTNSTDKIIVRSNGRLAIVTTPPLDSGSTYVLVWNSGTGDVGYRTAASLASSGSPVSGSGTLSLVTAGDGSHANPKTSCNLTYVTSSGTTSIDYRSTVYWTQGQAGDVIADDLMQYQPRFITPSGLQIQICQVIVSLGKAGIDDTILQVSILNDAGGTSPTPASPASTLTIPSGTTNMMWSALAGTTLNSLQHLQCRVDTAGSTAKNLNVHYWGKICPCG